jgi:hypothetical protein
MRTTHRFPIGTKYKPRGKHANVCTITDHLTVTNSKGEIVKVYYQSEHLFCEQIVTNYEVVDTTIAIGLLPEYQYLLNNV